MCVIIVNNKGKQIDKEVVQNASRINPHGLGVVWLDSFEITYHKSKEYKVLLDSKRPYIAHFRYATVGKVGRSNTHPFVCGKQKDEYLMMNGTVVGIGNATDCDSKLLARALGEVSRPRWAKELSKYQCRFVTVNKRKRTFQIYNKELWAERDGVWYSKTNLFQHNYIAVYGTLKKGHGNYYSYLTDSKFVGHGVTADKYPLVVSGLPYLCEDKGVGHNVKVDVFRVSDDVLSQLDRLEGHPTWYKRSVIPVQVGNKTRECWVYFRQNFSHKGHELHEEYSYKPQVSTKNDSWFESDWWLTERKKTKKVVEKETCIMCFSSLEGDAYGNYYCHTCEDWYTENQIYI